MTEQLPVPESGPTTADDALRREIASEQTYLDAAYARLDVMRRAAARVAATYDEVQRGGTHQARLERDVAITNTARRLAALDIGDAPLSFGRLDIAGPGGGTGRSDATMDDPDDSRFYVGRLAVDDESHQPLIVDWRAPVAEPFYRATAVQPMGVVRRRHFHSRGRELLGLDDEIFDAAATDDAGFTVVGEGALLAALDRHRTGRMGDIVATIQIEQDEAIRADLSGILVVAGGPGTGKTAVALHRAAYLLYTYRRKLESQGVLLIGPNPVFLRYIEQVLPSLGENDVHLATMRTLRSGVAIGGIDPPAVAALKGDPRLVEVISRALRDRERPLPRDVVVALDGHVIRLRRRDSRRIIERARQRRGTHNVRRVRVRQLLAEHLVHEYRRGQRRADEEYRRTQREAAVAPTPEVPPAVAPFDGSRDRAFEPRFPGIGADDFDEDPTPFPVAGDAPGDPDELDEVAAPSDREIAAVAQETDRELAKRLLHIPEIREALERMWPVLSGAELIHDLFSFRELIASAAGDLLTPQEQAALFRPRAASPHDVPWTDDDLPLIDEADALLGPVEAARVRRRRTSSRALDDASSVVEDHGLGGMVSASTIAERYFGPTGGSSQVSTEPRTYGHVVVDEAQDLSAMQWRMLARRCPSASMTIVGDFGQASRPGALREWSEVVGAINPRAGAQSARTVGLTVNYRTPAEVMEVADRVLAVAAPQVAPARSVRSTGEAPRFLRVSPEVLVREAAAVARRAHHTFGGTVAVIAPAVMCSPLVAALADVGATAEVADTLDAPVAVVGASDAKGLEFDHVIVVEPASLVPNDPAGQRLLYVTLTRPTRTLTVVHSRGLPDALRPAGHREFPAG